jgi:glutamate formiminotransferase/formiminotetrahydrofolate cyclodeaminase
LANSILLFLNSNFIMKQIIECVPNFSEGRDMNIIKQITDVIESVEGVKLLDVDPGKATNRTVVTFVGTPNEVIHAAFLAVKKASEIIDMSKHKGEHPRFGATDVCPLVPIANITMEETTAYAHKLAENIGKESLSIVMNMPLLKKKGEICPIVVPENMKVYLQN